MIGILCKHWQISPEEFGRLFNVAEPERYVSGELTLPIHINQRFTRVMQAASKMEEDGSVPFELQSYQEEHDLSVAELSDAIGVSRDGVRAWLRLDTKPSRHSTLRVACFLNRSPLEEEWAFQISLMKNNLDRFNMRVSFLSGIMGVTQTSASNWLNSRNAPRKVFMETWLPWVSRMNESFDPLTKAVQSAPNAPNGDDLEA